MFTGLIQAIGQVSESTRGRTLRLGVRARDWDHLPSVGDSVSIQGVCLTLAAPVASGVMAFDVVAETLAKTTLGSLNAGSPVNLERSLAAGDLMGGHIVQGHIDGMATVESVRPGADYRLRIRPDPGLMEYIIPKGAIALDGVSLTIAAATSDSFEVALIPTTLAKTTLANLRPGDRANVETDITARTVVHYLRHYAGKSL
jgi:riboflavin synthase